MVYIDNPLISVIIPVYNGEAFIEKCYTSINSQLLKQIEIIFVNDGSTDNTEMVVQGLCDADHRIRLVSKANEGQGIARNVGLDFARGKYVSFVDVDDKLPPHAFESLLELIESASADVVYGLSAGEGSTDSILPIKTGRFEDEPSLSYLSGLIVGGLPEDKEDSTLGMGVFRALFRREFLNSYGIRFLSERLVNSEDMLFNMDVLAVCRSACLLNKVVYTVCYDANPESYSKRYDPNRLEMFIRLRWEMMDRVKRWNRFKGFEIRVERRFLANCRVATKLAVFSRGSLSERLTDVEAILAHPRYRKSLATYPISKLPLKQRFFFELSKLRITPLVFALVRLRYGRGQQ